MFFVTNETAREFETGGMSRIGDSGHGRMCKGGV